MGLKSTLQNAKHETRYLLYGACGPLLQKFYESGFKNFDRGTLDNILGEESQLPDMAAAAGVLLASYKAGKAIDGKWHKLLRGSVQTMAYTGLVAATLYAGASIDSQANPDSIDYLTTMKNQLQGTISYFAEGKMAPLLYTALYGGLISGAARWAKNAGSYVVELFAGKAGPSKDKQSE